MEISQKNRTFKMIFFCVCLSFYFIFICHFFFWTFGKQRKKKNENGTYLSRLVLLIQKATKPFEVITMSLRGRPESKSSFEDFRFASSFFFFDYSHCSSFSRHNNNALVEKREGIPLPLISPAAVVSVRTTEQLQGWADSFALAEKDRKFLLFLHKSRCKKGLANKVFEF
ncbi:hypothetical protein J1N35_023761 [Gossypium stocksii]|uniref:Uncharacterized protein n=1 Tax=Gossypium stocksii TaxID=47602 RepID=A0A9D3VIQ2_9ROSI|nr:hypothetical protein J1N35_023761 [Gossypium stocksii]